MIRIIAYSYPIFFIVIGFILQRRLIAPNSFFGFRTSIAHASIDNWYQINSWAGLGFIIAGFLAIIFTFLVFSDFCVWRMETRWLASLLFSSIVVLTAVLTVVLLSEILL